jgi:hypothetical protein
MSLIELVWNFLDIAIPVLGEDVAIMLVSFAAGTITYVVLVSAAWLVSLIGPWALKQAKGQIWKRAERYVRKKGWSFQGFTVYAAAVAIGCGITVYICLKLALKFPGFWQIWGAILIANLVVFTVYGYQVTGKKITPTRFAKKFYVPTIAAVVMVGKDVVGSVF